MVRIFCAVSMVLVIAMGVSACQDRNSRNDGMRGASDPAAPHDINRNSQ
ncbi:MULTISPECIES: hypothetical protein [Acinetobacter]|nr:MULTISPECIES: hypothetical protein [Acinetobacter]MEB3794577.1 hypothetical protein [Acinetobacter sp. IK24]MEB3813699.1 hypothetical protein [Acinetobacter sp. IK22]MEB3832637.1 hypothetical protein [Acinetobacter sp. IK23]MEB3835614.1 hypothetical protein [Acinetobacter sp. IK25]